VRHASGEQELFWEVEAGVRRLADIDASEEGLLVVEQVRSTLAELRAVQENLARQNVELQDLQGALTRERRRYAELFELAPDAYFVTDENGKILEANGSAARLLGLRPQILVGKPFTVFVHPTSRPAVRRSFLHADRTPLALEIECTSRDGRSFVGDLRVGVADGDAGRGSRRLCILRDLTRERQAQTETQLLAGELEERALEQARVEAQLRAEEESRRRLRLLLERLHEGVVAVDRRLRVDFANTEALRVLAPARLQEGRRLPDPWPELSLVEVTRGLFAPDAALVDRLLHLPDADRTISVVGIPAKQMEVALLVIVDVSQRERRERAEQEFVANAAHELRTPLAAIAGAVDVLQGGAKDVPEERDRFLAHIERETARLGRLARALLLLARTQTLESRPSAEVVALGPLLAEAARSIAPLRGVEIEVDCGDHLAALANRDLAAQALATVAANAAKYTYAGQIRFAARRLDDARVVLEVTDTGPGVAARDRELVLGRFYRVGERGGDGFGLGLAIAEQAVKAIGGSLELDEAAGGGTAVRLVLPGAELMS
jgi:two-component system phosphate regulon sensor histidine kinase PhoR